MSERWLSAWIGIVTVVSGLALRDEPWEVGDRFERRAATYRFDLLLDQGELRDEVLLLARQCRMAALLDRRIDPNQPVHLRAKQLTFEQVLWQLGTRDRWAVAQLPNVFYIGPPTAALALPELLAELRSQIQRSPLPDDIKKKLMAERPLSSGGECSAPRDWVESLARDAGVTLTNLERIPHDWWAPLDWPPLPVYQQVALLLVGFDLWVDFGENMSLRIIDFPQRTQWRKSLSNLTDVPGLQRKLRSEFPDLRVTGERHTIRLEGTAEQVADAARIALAWDRPAALSDSNATYNLQTRGSRLAILTAIARQTDRDLEIDERLRAQLQIVIDLDASEVTLDELIRRTLAGTDLEHFLSASTLSIRQK